MEGTRTRTKIPMFFLHFLWMLLQVRQVVSASGWLSSSSSSMVAKPGCQERCGNLTIPYPFGIGRRCSFNEEFELACNSNNGSSTTWFNNSVQDISTDSVWTLNRFFPSLYNKSSGKNIYGDENSSGVDDGQYFRFSATKNKFVAIGCDIFAYIKDSNTGEIVSGCASICNSTTIASNIGTSSSYCTGNNGCCESDFSKMPKRFKGSIETMNTERTLWASSNCAYMLIVDKRVSDFKKFLGKMSSSDCNDFDGFSAEWVLDWFIGNVSCDKAIKSPKYACTNHSLCVDNYSGVRGYRCTCSPGYQGNPYLPNGCQDINECARPNNKQCPNNTLCVNTPGSFICEPNHGRHTPAMQLSLGIVAAISFIILVAGCLWLRRLLRNREEQKIKRKNFKRNGGLVLQQQISLNGESNDNNMLKLFSREQLEKATDNFNETRILGKGGLGTVYKGMLSDGNIIAVKKSNVVNEDQVEQFINEIVILSNINHRHIVKILGCCLETRVPLLVYEYVSNGTLSSHIHGNISRRGEVTKLVAGSSTELKIMDSPLMVSEPSKTILSWDHRLRIATEVAGALSYMHSCASTPILHRDIKSSNILLDHNFKAVVSDFGISRLISIDKTHLTTRVGGTIGYLDPEYFRSGQLNDKCDVYAFGVVVAELLTSQRAISLGTTNDVGLVMRFVESMKQGNLFEIVEPEIVKEVDEDKGVILAVAKLAKRCLHLNVRKRPSMKEVAAELDHLRRQDHLAGAESFQDNVSSTSQSLYSSGSDNVEEDNENYSVS